MPSINDQINSQGSYRTSSLATEASLIEELNSLRKNNEKNFNDYATDLAIKRYNLEINQEKQINDRRLAMAEDYEKKKAKALKKFKNKEDSKEFKEWEKKEQQKYDKQLARYKKYLDNTAKMEKRARAQAELDYAKETTKKVVFGKGYSLGERAKSIKSLKEGFGGGAVVDALISGIATLARQLDSTIDTIAGYQSRIDTRLMGSGKRWEGFGIGQGISNQLSGVVGMSPFIQTKKLYENVDKLADKGIAYNLEQRAFLETIAEKVSTTFHVDNQNLLNLIRVQQADTTAARLGLEANLNKYFNSMYETTEYLSDAFDSVSSSLYEATSQMGAKGGVGFEYQVQKWLGSLYSVGMSSNSVSNIASALGMLGAGNLSGLTGNAGMQNLLVMAASRRGMSYGDLLKGGLNANTTNQLLYAMVEYLAEIAKATEDNQVVRSKYAEIFGLSVSDLTAITNLSRSAKSIFGTNLDYGGAMKSLSDTANSIWTRTSVGEMMSNMWSNVQYNMASGIASNPALYGVWKVANMLSDTVGGIKLPDVSYMGTKVNLNTTVADLMRVGALSGGIFSGIGNIISAGAGGGFVPSMMLNALGLTGDKVSVVSRGGSEGLESAVSGLRKSGYTFVGNTAGSDIYNSEMAGAEETQQTKLAEVKEENASEVTNEVIDNHIVDIYELLTSIVSGGALNVRDVTFGGVGPDTGGLN